MKIHMFHELLPEQFHDKIKINENGCWEWLGALDRYGYAKITWQCITQKAHMVAYLLVRGKYPRHKKLDHLCRFRKCINPWHLEPVTNRENVRRGIKSRHIPLMEK